MDNTFQTMNDDLEAELAARGGRPIFDSDADIADYYRVWGE